MAQEALANVARHAAATEVEIRLLARTGGITMEIQDNGKGFVVEGSPGAKKSQRLGLLGMRERIEMVGGTLKLISAPGMATTVMAEFPAPLRSPKKRSAKSAPTLPCRPPSGTKSVFCWLTTT